MSPLFWLTYALRSLRRSGSRGIFALLCVIVGVGGVVALQTATLTIQSALTANVRAANGGDISVLSPGAPFSPADLAIFTRLRSEGSVSAWTAVSTLHATAIGPAGRLIPFTVDVVSAPPYPLGGQPTFVSPSAGAVAPLLAHHGSVLVTSVLADELGVSLGTHLTVNGIGGSGLSATITGILAETDFSHAATMTVNRFDASRLTASPPHVTAVYLNVPGPTNALAARLRTLFPSATVQTVHDALNSAQIQVHDFRQFMLLVGLLALLIAGAGILNAMQSILAQRRLEIAMLKTLGFGRGTLYALFGLEAILIGLVGGVLGTALGALLSKTIADTLARAMALQVTFLLDAGTLLAGIGLGIGAALIFAVLPIIRAAAIRPLEILREGAGPPLIGWLRTIGLVALLVALFAALASVTLGDTTLAIQFVLIALGICTLLTGLFSLVAAGIGRLAPVGSRFLGLIILVLLLAATVLAIRRVPSLAAILAVATLLWGATTLLPRRLLLPLIIGARSLGRRRTRTAVTLVAFLAGILSMTLTLTIALSLQRQINSALSSAGRTNLVAVSNPSGEPALVRAAHALPGIHTSSLTIEVQTETIAINGRPLASVIGPSPAPNPNSDTTDERNRSLSGITGFDLRHGVLPNGIRRVDGRFLTPHDAGTHNVMVHSFLELPPYNLSPGDTLTLREPGTGRQAAVTVVGFYGRARGSRTFGSFFTLPILGDRSLAARLGGSDAQVILNLGVDPNYLAADSTRLQRAVPGSLVIDVGDLTAVVEKILSELLQLLAVITGLVLGAGVAVVANGVGLAMLERRREIAIYKAIGFGPGAVLRFVLIENALIGTLAGAVSILAVAIALGLISRAALRQAVGFDPLVATLVLLLATALAVLTAYLAARHPLRIRPIEALRNE